MKYEKRSSGTVISQKMTGQSELVHMLIKYGLPVLIGVLSLFAANAISQLKLSVFDAWRYTSDIFTYDQMLQEMTHGYFGLEYTYGNQFGEHAYLILIPLLPFKFLFGKSMIKVLAVLAPLVYASMAIVIYLSIRSVAGTLMGVVLTLVYLVNFQLIEGLAEITYGCHFDTLSGFLATGFTALLIWRDWAKENNQDTKFISIGFWSIYVFFLGLKEEMALLAIFFSLIILFARRDRFQLAVLITAIVMFSLEIVMIKYCKTPFNRTNSELIRILLNDIQEKGLWRILTLPQFMKSYWPFISGAILAYVIVFLASGNRKIYAPALFLMGLMKMGFSFLVYDPNPVTWHNFPASIMMVGGMLLQLQQTPRMNLRPWPALRFYAALFLLSLAVYFFISTQVRFWEAIRYDYSRINAPKNVLESRMMSLAKVKKEIDSREVVAINGYTSKDWVDGYRYTFAMRGITNSPAGIADYIVFDKIFPGRREVTEYLAHRGKAEFEPIMNDDFFVLFKRKAITRENLASRRTFIENLGAETIGGGVQYQEVIVSDRETN